jgi:methionine synthase II (cobalamin-independent)
VKIATTGLAETALASFHVFERLRVAGRIPPGVRFQFCLPTVAAFLNTHVVLDCHAAIEEPYRHALFDDITRIAAAIPPDRLTLQWDVSTEMAQWEGVREAHFAPVRDGVIERLALHCNQVPAPVELGVHLCYGNFGLRHWREPSDLANCVAVFNGLAARANRAIDYVHMPVPIERDDDAYFAPLDALRLGPHTKLYLGLVHERDGIDGARRRIDAARRHAGRFGVATECGFGSRPPEVVPDLLRLHADIADTLFG